MITTAGLLIAGGLLAGAYALSRNSQESSKISPDDTPTTLATRGSYLNYVLGRRRVGVLFGWAGYRLVREEGGSSGGKGGPDTPGSDVYYEDAWLQVCVGPANGMYGIWINGELVVNQEWHPDTHPSGTYVEIDGHGSVGIYWGEKDQPVNEELAAGVGAASRWPYLCYLHVLEWKLGNSPQWGQWEVEVECLCATSTLSGSELVLDDSNGARGINAAHACLHILTAPMPHGCGLPGDWLDATSLSAFGVLCESEHLPMNLLFEAGANGRAMMQAIMADAGLMTPMIGTRMGFLTARQPEGDLPVLSDDTMAGPYVRFDANHGPKQATRVTYTYARSNYNYRLHDIKFDDDGVAKGRGGYVSLGVELMTVTDKSSAAKVARRRIQEDQGDHASVSVRVLRGFASMIPGQQLQLPDGRIARVIEVTRTNTAIATLNCVVDAYGTADIDDEPAGTIPVSIAEPVAADLHFDFIQLPASLTNATAVGVFRLRAHQQISKATIYISSTGTSFYAAGSQAASAAGGEILTPIAVGDASPIDQGPYLIDVAGDVPQALDLSGDADAHAAGKQVCLIGREVMFAERFELIGGEWATRATALAPLAWYRMDEESGTTATNAGGGADGSYVGGVTLGGVSLLAGDVADGSAAFDGTDGRIETGLTVIDSTADWSVAAVVQLTQTTVDQVVADREDGSGTGRVFLGVRGTGAGASEGRLFADIGGVEFESASVVAWGQAVAIGVVYDSTGDVLRFVVGDVADDPVDASTATPTAASGQLIVGRDKSAARPLAGVMCEFLFAEQAISAALFAGLIGSATSTAKGWRLRGLIRAQHGTTAEDHAVGEPAYVIQSNQITPITDALIQPGATIYLKSRPTTASSSTGIGEIVAVSHAIT